MYGNADDWRVIRECHEKSMREAIGIKNCTHFNRYYLVQPLLPCDNAFDGFDRANGSGASPISAAEIQVGMSYYINATMSISFVPFVPSPLDAIYTRPFHAPVYFDLKHQRFVPAGTRGAKEIGTAAITSKIGDKMVIVQINGS